MLLEITGLRNRILIVAKSRDPGLEKLKQLDFVKHKIERLHWTTSPDNHSMFHFIENVIFLFKMPNEGCQCLLDGLILMA